MTFGDELKKLDWNSEKLSLYGKTAKDVERALSKQHRDAEDFKALISPAAAPYLETMAQMSHALTQQRFGRTQQFFAPLYLSNACANICTYCGFSMENHLRRKVLARDEIEREAQALRARGFQHILLVTGEAPKIVGVDYFEAALKQLTPHFAQISMEVQSLSEPEYARLMKQGLHSVLVYQETYHRHTYAQHHPKGNKANFDYRLDTMDRLGRTGVHKMGLGVLLGLTDWRADSVMAAHHLRYLERTYWRSRFSISFPRLRPAEGDYQTLHPIADAELVQLICAWRLFSPDVELSLSTRERAAFRDQLIPLGITALSAESKTQPGGYAVDADKALEQFEIDDTRPLEHVVTAVQAKGYETVFKDWQTGW
ncbi:MAG: 2-iminoacetate synthase ThiH [Natronospirillum sp.]